MNNNRIIGIFLTGASLFAGPLLAKETVYKNGRTVQQPRPAPVRAMAGCDPASSQVELDINNVRALLFNGGDMWWAGGSGTARYEIPKLKRDDPAARHSLFAGSVWFGGVDANNVLKTAGQTYRQFPNGTQGANDFWPGPLDTTNATIGSEECLKWDQHFKINKEDIDEFKATGEITSSIANWPAHGDISKNQAQYLAPFRDMNGNGAYDPVNGDFPYLDACGGATVIPDQMIWWVYNDKGNIHTKYTGGDPIGLEVHAMAFAFKAANEINNMTFYKYKIFNRASTPLNDTYFAQWVDADLGNAADDYVGCDVNRSLGYVYNGDGDDDGTGGYGLIPPAVGIDFFRGPKDENGKPIPLSKFMYFTNSAPVGQDDPANATELYRYLRGIWGDGIPLTYGGTGHTPGNTDTANYAFPGTTDPLGRPTWSEVTESNPVGDRRLVQSVGPFKLQPGAVNEVIVGVVWARATSGNQINSLNLLYAASDKAQVLFDNCFELASGPPPVLLKAIEQENKIILALEGTQPAESYDKMELDDQDTALVKYRYKFQGYRIYQLKTSGADLSDETQAVEIATVDIKDDVTRIINKVFDTNTENFQAQVMVEGSDNGIRHTFEVTKDAFSLSADNTLANYKTYYFTVIPYAYADSAKFTRYLPSRSSGSAVSAIPHKPLVQNYLNNQLMTGVPIKRIEGAGNDGNVLDIEMTDGVWSEIAATKRIANPLYLAGKGPVSVKVYDPRAVPNQEFELIFTYDSLNNYPGWKLVNLTTGVINFSDTSLGDNEQVIYDNPASANPKSLGFTVTVRKVINPGEQPLEGTNGFLEATMEFANPDKAWFKPLRSSDVPSAQADWIFGDPAKDPNEVYKTVLDGGFAPYRVVAFSDSTGPGLDNLAQSKAVIENTGSVDLVLTNDKTKWTECVVVESGTTTSQNEGKAKRLHLRAAPGFGGRDTSRSVFPGYAINLETGERLNIFFAECSTLPQENGRDMVFNPTSHTANRINGGRHYLYIHRTKYDSCNAIYNTLKTGSLTKKRELYANVDWVAIPTLAPGQKLPWDNNMNPVGEDNPVKIRLRVAKSYRNYVVDGSNQGAPYYYFNTSEVVQAFNESKDVTNKDALKLINIVPNPYYSFSGYEGTQNDFKIRITNLPKLAYVTIYTSNGLLVRKLTKDDINQTYIDWDLQNANQVPIASGMYLIHIKVPNVGERTLKWFGVMRPLDFENF